MNPESKPPKDEGLGLDNEAEPPPRLESQGGGVSARTPHLFATMLLAQLVHHSKTVGWHHETPSDEGDDKEKG